MSEQYVRWRHEAQPGMFELIPTLELTTGQWGGSTFLRGTQGDLRWATKASTSYVTGSHNFKTGIDVTWGSVNQASDFFADTRNLFFLAGDPFLVTVTAGPLGNYEVQIQRDIGVFVQDQWTTGQLTLNLGARFDHFRTGSPPQSAPAGTWVGPRDFGAIRGVNWTDGSVRFGVAYDLFGDGRTALKGNVNQYISGENVLTTLALNPLCCDGQIFARSETRAWTDLDGNRDIIDRVAGRVQYEEVGASGQGADFGQVTDVATLDPDLQRDGNWEYSVSVQHELVSGLSVTAGVYRRDFNNQIWTDNRLLGPSNYTPFTITGPADSRLPNGGSEQITLFNLNPDSFGIGRDPVIGNSDINDIRYLGFELVVDGRLQNGAFFGGSVTREKTQVDTCEVDNPNNLRFCDAPRAFQTLYKIHGLYPLPGGVLLSAFLQGMPVRRIARPITSRAWRMVPRSRGGKRSESICSRRRARSSRFRRTSICGCHGRSPSGRRVLLESSTSTTSSTSTRRSAGTTRTGRTGSASTGSCDPGWPAWAWRSSGDGRVTARRGPDLRAVVDVVLRDGAGRSPTAGPVGASAARAQASGWRAWLRPGG